MIIYVAGLNNVSPDLIEAAQIDGATARQILFKIKIPMIMPSVTICTFLTLTNGFKMFDQNLSLTGGAPGKQSQLLALNIYDTFYARSGPHVERNRTGKGSCILCTGCCDRIDPASCNII